MLIVRTLSLSLAAIAFPIVGFSMDIGVTDQSGLCGGRAYTRISVPNGASPYLELTADGVTGPFLLDYGATRSSLSAGVFSGPDGSMRTAAISLPRIERADFHLARYYHLLQPGKGQLGVIGDDLLCKFILELTEGAAFLSTESCRREALIARGLTPVAQNGFFSSDPSKIGAGLPNVPVVFLRVGDVRVWAQIDTGYEDFVYSHSVDINQALFDRLVGRGVRLDRVNDIDIWTCDGREHRPVYQVKGRPLTIENENGKQIVETEDFHLVVKPANSCGGIADMTEPAAQLGASFLNLFGAVIFDPRNATVWLGGPRGEAAAAGDGGGGQ
jgi:hypothetical protein